MSNRPIKDTETEFNKLFGSNLKHFRKARKYTQTNIANEIGVSFQAVQKYEKGMCSPSPFNLHKMSIFLEVKLDDLMDPRFMDRLTKFKEEQAFREMDLDDVIYEKTTIKGTATIKPKRTQDKEWL